MDISAFETNLKDMNHLYQNLVGGRSSLLKKQNQKTQELKTFKDQQVEIQKVKLILEDLIKQYIGFQLSKIEEYVTYGLRTVIPDQKLSFKCQVMTKNGKPWVEFVTSSTEGIPEGEDPIEENALESFGGSVAQVESLILRILAVLQLKLYPLIVMDESLNAVSEDYMENLSLLLKELSKQLKVKILLVTHNKEILVHADRVYRAVNNGDRMAIERISKTDAL